MKRSLTDLKKQSTEAVSLYS